MLLALLALGVPTAALATSVNFSSGTFQTGTFTGSFTTMVEVSVVGTENTISIDTGKLSVSSSCPIPGAKCYSFTTGNVTVAAGTTTEFTDSLVNGFIINHKGDVTIGAILVPNTIVASGSTSFHFALQGTTLTRGAAGVQGTAVPELGTFGLLGYGLIGLAWMTKHKLKMAHC